MWAVSVLLFFVFAVVGHAVLCWLPVAGNMVTKFLLVGGLSGLALSIRVLRLYGLGVETWTALLLYACVAEFYIFVCALVMSSVSISLLLTLREGSLTRPEIDRLFGSVSMVDERLRWLVTNGLLEGGPSRYAVTKKASMLVGLFEVLRAFFRLDKR